MFIVFTRNGADITKGRIYETQGDYVIDDRGHFNWSHTGVMKNDFVQIDETVYQVLRRPGLRDICGNDVKVGDTVAYAYGTGTLSLFEVLSINNGIAQARSKSDGIVTALGMFDSRALKVPAK